MKSQNSESTIRLLLPFGESFTSPDKASDRHDHVHIKYNLRYTFESKHKFSHVFKTCSVLATLS